MPRTPIDYSKTIIYKIVCNDLNIKDLYVGSTTDFNCRKTKHKSRCKSKDMKVYNMINENGGWENWSMVEIEKYPCKDSNEARARERFYYEALNAGLNAYRPIISKDELKEWYKIYNKEFRENNRDRVNELALKSYHRNVDSIRVKQKLHRENNKEAIKQRKSIKIMCLCCDKLINKEHKARHERTKAHLNALNK
jgi:hypothetical protein